MDLALKPETAHYSMFFGFISASPMITLNSLLLSMLFSDLPKVWRVIMVRKSLVIIPSAG